MGRLVSIAVLGLWGVSLMSCRQELSPDQPSRSTQVHTAAAATLNVAAAVAPVPSQDGRDDQPSQFFKSLSGHLEIELTEPAKPVSDKVMNLAAPSTARIKSLRLSVAVQEGKQERNLTNAELDRVALRSSHVVLRGESGKQLTYDASNGEYFTVRQLVECVEEAERVLRANTQWMGGIDVDHVYFEGLQLVAPGTYEILWGS
ncbi:MAG TPA: hypothetical protein VHM70_32835 [Polyangiaceae bacterium]|jgi:hypothetical protein|nr:hypothetical protein [Polyangiaceae bacterium]